MSPNIIYGLQDPITNEIRYIGKSTKGIERPECHLLPCYYKSKKMYHYPVYRWIRKLLRIYNSFPKIILIQSFENISIKNLNECEKYWIAYFREQSFKKLLNSTIGGDGSVGYSWTEEQRKNLSEIRKVTPRSEAWKKKAKEFLKDVRTRVPREEMNKRVSEGTKNWWKTLDDEIKNKIIKGNLIPGNNKIKIKDQFGNIYDSKTEAAKKIGCNSSAISMAMKDKRACKGFIFTEVNDA